MEKQHYTEIDLIKKIPRGSIKDYDVFLSLVKYCNGHPEERDLLDRIDPRFSYVGLYSTMTQKFDILPDFLKDEKKL